MTCLRTMTLTLLALLAATPFYPNGPHKPGADWQSERDQAAAKHVFDLPTAQQPRASDAGERLRPGADRCYEATACDASRKDYKDYDRQSRPAASRHAGTKCESDRDRRWVFRRRCC